MVSHKPWHLVLAVMVMPVLSNSDSEDDCHVRHSVQMDQLGAVPLPLLAYVSRSTNLTLGFFFRGMEAEQERDAVCLNSTGATHSVVRSGKATWTPVDLPRLIPEGWNTFTVAVAEKVTVTRVQGTDQMTLFKLPLPHHVTKVFAEGTVARCSKLSPEWEVAMGREVEVVLQPGGSDHDQWVEVTGDRGKAAAPYLSFPSSPDTMFNVPANTILRIASSLRGDHTLVRVIKDGDGSGEEVVKERVPITPPLTMLVGSGGGGDGPSIHLRLMLSPPPMNGAQIATSSSSGAEGLGPIALGVPFIVVLGAVIYHWRNRRKRHLLLRKEKSINQVIPETLPNICRQPEFEGRLIHASTNGIQKLRLHLVPDMVTVKLLNALITNISNVDILLVIVSEAAQLHAFKRRLPVLPDIEKVKLKMTGFAEGDLANVCELVKNLQPSHGYAIIDFQGDISSSSGDGVALREEVWEDLLRRLHEMEVKVKGKVLLPTDAITEERRKLLPLSFAYMCHSANESIMTAP